MNLILAYIYLFKNICKGTNELPIPRSKNINPKSLAEKLLSIYDDINTTLDNNKDMTKKLNSIFLQQ